MRLKKNQIQRLAEGILENLCQHEAVTLSVSREKIVGFIEQLITEDLMVEDRLNDEVRQILDQYTDEIEKGRVDYHRMFQMIKRKLVRERNLVL